MNPYTTSGNDQHSDLHGCTYPSTGDTEKGGAVSSTNAGRALTRRWLRGGAAVLTAAVIGLGAQACGTSQVAVPAGPASSSPSAKTGNAATKSPSPKPAESSSAKQKMKQADPVRPHGNIKQRTTTHTVKVQKKTPMAKAASFSDGVEVSVAKIRSVTAKAVGPGEVGGSAVAATMKIKNGSVAPIDLGTVSVRLLGSDGSPGIMTSGGEAKPLTGTLKPDESIQGTYVFTLDKSMRKPVTVQVEYGSGQTVLQFSGNAG